MQESLWAVASAKSALVSRAREEVNDEEGDLEMADSVAYQHTDGNRNHDGSYELHGIKKVGTDRGHKVPGTP